MALVKHKPGYYTYRDNRCWPESERLELLDGAAYLTSPAPNWLHQEVLMEVARQPGNQLKGHRCRLAIAPLDVRLPHSDEADELVDTVVQPDLLIVCDARQIVADGVRGAPTWVLERYRKFKRPFLAVSRVGGGRGSAGLGKDQTCASALRHHVGAQPGRPWPFLTESRHRAKRAPAGSSPQLMAVGFRGWEAWAIRQFGFPMKLRVDNDPPLKSALMRATLRLLGVKLQVIQLACPWMNGRI